MAEPEKDAPVIQPTGPKQPSTTEPTKPKKKDDGLGPIPLFTNPGRIPQAVRTIGKIAIAAGATFGFARLLGRRGTRSDD